MIKMHLLRWRDQVEHCTGSKEFINQKLEKDKRFYYESWLELWIMIKDSW